ncbi:uncharacterized protein LOC127749600 [Frankliniella occidentalis]|uniref:Uncharacterized protein LOC127749600 n=1 Tax=Frankliniella occidentalis TaxID=133901 RepID=A0A9C6WQ96_FRAOC|nr:uncharacterized protein LOC127749600 [Frankliniella occidentalis]
MIAKDNMPLSTTQREGFQTFCHTLQPNFKLPCSSMVTKEVEMSYERLREKFAAKLSVMESLTMTADIWTSQAMKSFLGVTAHFPEKKENHLYRAVCKASEAKMLKRQPF